MRFLSLSFRQASILVAMLSASWSVALLASGDKSATQKALQQKPAALEGRIKIDGSSTVYPITEATAEEFQKTYKNIKITIGVSGTGGGFKKFIAEETDINNASRAIKASEQTKADQRQLRACELPVAYDGISVVVHPQNNWVDSLTTEQLAKIWEPESSVKLWSDIDPSWPKRAIKLYGPGADSGTFDYFTEQVNGKSRASRSDYTASEDDSVLVKGVSKDKDSLGYFGFAYYEENKDKLKVIALQQKDQKAVAPTIQSIADGTYFLARPVFIYVSHGSAQKVAVKTFVEFYLNHAKNLAQDVGYIPLSDSAYGRALTKFQQFAGQPSSSKEEKTQGAAAKASKENQAGEGSKQKPASQ